MKKETIKIKETDIVTDEPSGFSVSVAGRDWRGRHGNITVRETHRPSGVWRAVNINNSHREEGPWMQTIDNTARIAALATRLADLEGRMGQDLTRAQKDGLAKPSLNASVRGIKEEIEKLKKAQGSFPVAAEIVE